MKKVNNIPKFIKYLKPYKARMVFQILASMIAVLSGISIPLFIRQVVENHYSYADIMSIAAKFVLVVAIQIITEWYSRSLLYKTSSDIKHKMSKDAYVAIMRQSHRFFAETKVGALLDTIIFDVDMIVEILMAAPTRVGIPIARMVISIVVMFSINVPLTIAVICVIPFIGIAYNKMSNKMIEQFMQVKAKRKSLLAITEDSLVGARCIKEFSNEEFFTEKFNQISNEFKEEKAKSIKINVSMVTVNISAQLVINLIMIIFGGLSIMSNKITAGDMIVFMTYTTMFVNTIDIVGGYNREFNKAIVSMDEFFTMMEHEPEIQDDHGATTLHYVKGDIDLNNVTFGYNNPIINKFNLHIPAGKSVAIVGASGSGKSTLCNLIPRFYDVQDGSIRIDGHDIRSFTIDSVRSHIGIVSQDTTIFSDTILGNIKIGKLDASYNEVVEAAQKAGIHDFIMSLPDGYNTFVGERGLKLSGGQRQRISIARVFLKNPSILILDEATSALDNISERWIQHSLAELAKNRTTITIAHRLSTIRDADNIVVLANGQIVESGTHRELLELGGYYAKMINAEIKKH